MSRKRAQAVLILSTAANIALFGLKVTVGILASSRALLADGINSGLDIFFSVMILISFRLASKPPDKEHPYGHGNIEVLVAFIAALVIFATGGFLIYDGINTSFNPRLQAPGWMALAAAGFTILTKVILYIYAGSVSRKWRSPAVKVQAADHLVDIMATSVAVVGIFVARMGVLFFDPVGAVIIGGFICWTGIKLLRENIKVLLDAHPAEKFLNRLKECARGCKGVTQVPTIRAHPVGTYFFLEITVTVKGNLSVKQGHDIAEGVKQMLMDCEGSLKDVIVHVEPASD
ncbi:cation diffusion facilitator family transporter [candidate division WOR-3 bacterium]|uniref:Cation diffusion facilitator family transporter n=1 Tax=candidate division WOR-3 bacterium TaxID=2052148 RepID=A0A9D5QCW2_UNCW3|nr:cation diffusion facilitator family transporter [candidate division WOR-3 bacterium]MBD3365098.1 cation diffusion facilitator family transporter [candidate division WOR-3 bacterium]